jgi:hypothetical protein
MDPMGYILVTFNGFVHEVLCSETATSVLRNASGVGCGYDETGGFLRRSPRETNPLMNMLVEVT